MQYLKGIKDYMLMCRWTNSLEVVRYVDSDFVGCVDSQKSTSSYVFMLANGAVSWKSVKQKLTAT